MRWILNGYHDNKDYQQYTDDVVLYDKKDLNVGANIYDYMDYIVNNYDNLPEIMLFGKTNMFERHITKEEFEKVKDNKTLTLLLTQNHRTYSDNDGVVCYYENGLYYERNDFWYLREHPTKTVNSKNDLVKLLNLTDKYIGFAPGGCCIVPRENILKHSKEIYQKLKDCTSWHQFPGEAYLIERGLYNLWL